MYFSAADEDDSGAGGDKDEKGQSSSRWRKCERLSLSKVEGLDSSEVITQHEALSMFECFSIFFTEDMITDLVEQTNLYVNRDKNDPSFKTNVTEMKQFLGLLLVSGYHWPSSETDCWSTADDVEAPIFAKVFARDPKGSMGSITFLKVPVKGNVLSAKKTPV